jgi:hypothetical protein
MRRTHFCRWQEFDSSTLDYISAPFNERTAALLARAEAGGRGDAPPLAFLGC